MSVLEKLVLLARHEIDEPYGCDIETMPLPEYKEEWEKVVGKKGAIYAPGLDPYKSAIRLIQLSDKEDNVVVFDAKNGIPTELKLFLESNSLVGQNFCFDLKHLIHAGIVSRNNHCIQQMYFVLGKAKVVNDKNLRPSLAELSKEILGLEIDKEQQVSDWSGDTLSPAQLRYAALDPILTRKIYEVLAKEISIVEATEAYNAYRKALLAFAYLELNPRNFDLDAHKAFCDKAEHSKREAYEHIRKHISEGEVPNLNSPSQLVNFITQKYPDQVNKLNKTKTGKLSMSDSSLKKLLHLPFVEALQKYKKAEKKLNSFGEKFHRYIHPETRGIHPRYILHSAATGRSSSNNPNFQQLMNDKDFLHCFTPRKNHCFIKGDMSQVELRAIAEISTEPKMREVFITGGDMHKTTASAISGVPVEEIGDKDVRRKAAKAINFGIAYGSGARGISNSATDSYDAPMSEDEAREHLRKFRRAYPTFTRWEERVRSSARRSKSVATIGGKIRRFAPDHVKGKSVRERKDNLERLLYTAPVNLIIQGTCAEIQMLALGYIQEEILNRNLDTSLINQVHDDITLECPEHLAEAAKQVLQASMIKAFKKYFPNAPTNNLVTPVKTYSFYEGDG